MLLGAKNAILTLIIEMMQTADYYCLVEVYESQQASAGMRMHAFSLCEGKVYSSV